jgi:hypothetical protein
MSQAINLLPFETPEEAGNAVVAALSDYPVVALVLAAVGVLLLAIFLIRAGRFIKRSAIRMWRGSRARRVRNKRDHRALILVGDIKGNRGHATRRAVRKALEEHFGGFAFAAPVSVEYLTVDLATPADGPALDATLREADRILTATNADLLIWGSHRLWGNSLSLRMMAPTAPEMARTAATYEIRWNGRGDMPDDAGEALAYAAARRVRPVLNRPHDYKPERLQDIVKKLDGLMTSPPKSLNADMRKEFTTDFASGALSLGERGGDIIWLRKALTAREEVIEGMVQADDPVAWGRAQQEIGRCLAALGERDGDRATLERAVSTLKLSLDALRYAPEMQAADGAMKALGRAEQAMQMKKRVGLRWPIM